MVLDTEQSYFSYLVPYWQERMRKRFGSEVAVADVKLVRSPRASGRRKSVTRGQLINALGGTLGELGVQYADSHLGAIADILSPDFSVDVPTDSPSVIVLQAPEVEELLGLHGVDAGKEVSSGGRVELRLRQTPVHDSVLRRIVRETGTKLLVYDSISAPFKSAFPSTQDLPARSAGLAMILAHAQRLCVEFEIAVVVVSHVSIDPIHAWDRRPYGGVILGHEAKFSLELTKGTAKRNEEATAVNPEDASEGARAFWVARHPARADYSLFGYARIDDEGFH